MTPDVLLGDLRGRLHGPRGVRKALLQEVDDGLQDAAAAYRDAGLPPDEADRRAVDEFGEPADLAPLYQAELDATQGRRTAMLIAVAFPLLTLAWDVLWWLDGSDQAVPKSLATVAGTLDLFSYGSAIVAAAAIPFFGRCSASGVRRLTLAVGAQGWLTLLFSLGAATWMAQVGSGSTGSTGRLGIAVVLLTIVASTAIAWMGTLTLIRASRAR